ncbi:MAG: hypothetical protein QW717_02255 [Candidatus Bathyarchaeia archaeon]
MAKTDYEKYVIREPIVKDPMGPILHVDAKTFPNFPVEMVIMGIHDPNLWGAPPPHTHPADEIFFFLGGNPKNFFEADFEAEIWLGEEGCREKVVVNTPSVLYVPKGVLHCPFTFTKVSKPIFYGHILLHPIYESSKGGTDQTRTRPYTLEEKAKLRAGIIVP